MALLPCPNCGHQISDKADVCPFCGNKLNQKNEMQEKISNINANEKKAQYALASIINMVIKIAFGIGLLIAAIYIFVLISNYRDAAKIDDLILQGDYYSAIEIVHTNPGSSWEMESKELIYILEGLYYSGRSEDPSVAVFFLYYLSKVRESYPQLDFANNAQLSEMIDTGINNLLNRGLTLNEIEIVVNAGPKNYVNYNDRLVEMATYEELDVSNYINIGSTKEHVETLMGTPESINDYSYFTVWSYVLVDYTHDYITFDSNGRVSEWDNNSGQLKIYRNRPMITQ